METGVTVFTHTADTVEINRAQILRYAGILNAMPDDNTEALIDKCLPVMTAAMKFKACFLEVPVKISGNSVSLEYFTVESLNLKNVLSGCDRAVLVAATAGPMTDIVIKRAEVTSKAEALILNAIAIAGIESYMSVLNNYLKERYEGKMLRPRFSPGYGDVPLSVQTDLLRVLDTGRKIGVTLADSLLMVPSKSVSAIIGISESGCMHIDKDCDMCAKSDCEFRLS